ncbi:MAG: flagellar motor protein MotB [Sedimentisphaerales bacterium]|nr:flagellar motor protein MotB [Sedimentisphaerales bacterium]
MSKQKPPEEEGGEGAPLWIVSFADMASLLMAFFVMLTTFSTFDNKAAKELEGIGKRIVNSGGWNYKKNYNALMAQQPSANFDDTKKGSEKPTADNTSNRKSLKTTAAKDFRNHRVFVLETHALFWSRGSSLSSQGSFFLQTLAAFVKKVPSRIVISEYGSDNPSLGLERAWAAAECLIDAGMSPSLCNISAQTLLAEQKTSNERSFEITILDKSIYK